MRLPFCDYHICMLLERFETASRPLDSLLSEYFRSHKSIGANDRRTIGETLYQMVRFKSLYIHLCSSTVAKHLLTCFKNVSLEKCVKDNSIPEAARLGVNEFLYKRFSEVFGLNKTREICLVLSTQAPTTVRANLLKTTRANLLRIWNHKFSVQPTTKSNSGIQFTKREPLFSLKEFKDGLFEMQDEGSQLISELVDIKPKDHFLDYCSGSGGKTLAIAPNMQEKGQIYLYDIRPWALKDARKRLKRAGVQNAQFKLPKKKVDWLLTDVPCSGTGTLRRNPDAKWRIDGAMIERLVQEQREIVAESLKYLKDGGRLVYATCSILPEENIQQVNYFLKTHPSLTLEKKPLFLLPEKEGTDGFFAAVFKKQTLVPSTS